MLNLDNKKFVSVENPLDSARLLTRADNLLNL